MYHFPKKFFRENFWESNTDNLYYGHYNILKRYSKTLFPYKINGEVQHGWSPDHGIAANPFLHNESDKSKRYYLINKNNKKKSLGYGYNNVIIMGAPFIYLPNILKKNNSGAEKNIIFFPLHTHEYDCAGDPYNNYFYYLKELRKITKFFRFITICLGWREYNNKKITDLIKDHGMKIVTMGPRDNNPNFLYKFFEIVNNHEYVSSESFSSAIFYSLLLRKKVFIYGKSMSWGEKETWEGKLDLNYNKVYSNKYPQLMWENFNHKPHFEIGQKELGFDHKLTPKKLRETFGWSIKNIF